jgi:hypothetical protein
MHCWNALVCHPRQYKGSIDRQLQPPPTGDDLPSLLKDKVWILLITAELDQSSADPIQLCAHIADHPISLRLGCYESQIFVYVEKNSNSDVL